MRWTKEDTECLMAMRDAGWRVQDIVREMGFSDSTIEYHLKKNNLLKNKKWADDEDKNLIELTYAGKSIKECADTLGRSIDNIKHRRMHLKITHEQKRLGITPTVADASYTYSQKPDKLTKVYLIDFGDFYKVGTTQQMIHERFGAKYPKYEVVFYIETTLQEAKQLESAWLANVKHLQYTPDCFPKEGRGYTECFKV
jgi:hypothetical protein